MACKHQRLICCKKINKNGTSENSLINNVKHDGIFVLSLDSCLLKSTSALRNLCTMDQNPAASDRRQVQQDNDNLDIYTLMLHRLPSQAFVMDIPLPWPKPHARTRDWREWRDFCMEPLQSDLSPCRAWCLFKFLSSQMNVTTDATFHFSSYHREYTVDDVWSKPACWYMKLRCIIPAKH